MEKKYTDNNYYGFKKKRTLSQKIHIDFPLLGGLLLALGLSLIVLYSASGQHYQMILKQIIHTALSFGIMIVIAQFNVKFFERWCPVIFLFCIIMLLGVTFFGEISKGARRWLNLGIMRIQPSEFLKIAMPITIAAVISRNGIPPKFPRIATAVMLVAIPSALIAKQPDLGTAILVATTGCIAIFLGGISWWYIISCIVIAIPILPVLWHYVLHEYQKQRVLTFLNPESDPLGSGYNIIQSKIAIGSGGVYGKGWLHGTQSQLDFLPEHHTDFIFAVFSEEFGMMGFFVLMLIYMYIIFRCLYIASRAKRVYEKILAGTLSLTFFFYIFVNIGMVSGILPVVGVRLPLISYGGTSMVTLCAGFGLIMSIHTHRNTN